MPAELPGYYFDAERNRYFPNSSRPAEPPPPPPRPATKKVTPIPKLWLDREINATYSSFFRQSALETFAVRPQVWTFDAHVLQSAICWGYCNCLKSETVFLGSCQGTTFINKANVVNRRPNVRAALQIPGDSMVTAVKTLSTRENMHKIAIIARLGNVRGGGLEVFDLESLRSTADVRTKYTVFTADIFPCGTKASLGTHSKAGVVDLPTGRLTWICSSPIAILSQKTDASGNIVVSGFRNGCILALDTRERLRYAHRELRSSIQMQSSVCSVLLLPSDENYIVASDLSDNIQLWDRRIAARGPLRSFAGHKNTFLPFQLGIDPTGSLLMSGGEDNAVRIWSLRTGDLLLRETGFRGSPEKLVFRGAGVDNDELWSAWITARDGLHYMQADRFLATD